MWCRECNWGGPGRTVVGGCRVHVAWSSEADVVAEDGVSEGYSLVRYATSADGKSWSPVINLAVVQQPLYLVGTVLVAWGLLWLRARVRRKYNEVCYALRAILLAEPDLRCSSLKHNLAIEVTSDENTTVSP